MSSRLWDSGVKLLPPDYQFIAVAHQGFPRQGANLLLPPATKLGQGNIFRSVCQEFCSQGGSTQTLPLPGAGTPPPPPRSRHSPGAVHAGRYGQEAGGTHPTGMHSCLPKCL